MPGCAHFLLLVLLPDDLSASSPLFIPRSLNSPSSSPPSSPSSRLPPPDPGIRPVVDVLRLLGLDGKDDEAGARDVDVGPLDAEPDPEPEPGPDPDPELEEDGPVGGRAGRAADAGGVEDLDLPDLPEGLCDPGPDPEPDPEPDGVVVVLEDPPMVGWKGSDMDDSFTPLPPVLVLLVEAGGAFSSTSIFSGSSSIGMVAFGSMGSLRSRQSLTRSEILVKMSIRPWAVS